MVAISLLRLAVDVLIVTRLLGSRDSGLRLQQGVCAAFFSLEALVMVGRVILGVSGLSKEGLYSAGPVSIITFVGAFIVPICVAISLLSLAARKPQLEQEKTIGDLEAALGRVKTLSGLLPICGSCKRICDAEGEWRQVETYVRDRTDASFSHGICPECEENLYPELSTREKPDRS